MADSESKLRVMSEMPGRFLFDESMVRIGL